MLFLSAVTALLFFFKLRTVVLHRLEQLVLKTGFSPDILKRILEQFYELLKLIHTFPSNDGSFSLLITLLGVKEPAFFETFLIVLKLEIPP